VLAIVEQIRKALGGRRQGRPNHDERSARDGEGDASVCAAFRKQRCLVPVAGFCEVHRKAWYRFTLSDAPLFAFAGLWERWDKSAEPLETFTVLTTEVNERVAKDHAKKRMPVIRHRDDFDLWLHGMPDEVPVVYGPDPADGMAVAPVA
jgi:putative SOS response-associated peptidase YedK